MKRKLNSAKMWKIRQEHPDLLVHRCKRVPGTKDSVYFWCPRCDGKHQHGAFTQPFEPQYRAVHCSGGPGFDKDYMIYWDGT